MYRVNNILLVASPRPWTNNFDDDSFLMFKLTKHYDVMSIRPTRRVVCLSLKIVQNHVECSYGLRTYTCVMRFTAFLMSIMFDYWYCDLYCLLISQQGERLRSKRDVYCFDVGDNNNPISSSITCSVHSSCNFCWLEQCTFVLVESCLPMTFAIRLLWW